MASTYFSEVNVNVIPWEQVAFEDTSTISKGIDTVIDKVLAYSDIASNYTVKKYNTYSITSSFQSLRTLINSDITLQLLMIKNVGEETIIVKTNNTISDPTGYIAYLAPNNVLLMTLAPGQMSSTNYHLRHTNTGESSDVEIFAVGIPV